MLQYGKLMPLTFKICSVNVSSTVYDYSLRVGWVGQGGGKWETKLQREMGKDTERSIVVGDGFTMLYVGRHWRED